MLGAHNGMVRTRYALRTCRALAPKYQLHYLHPQCTLICMRTTLNIDNTMLQKAACITGIREKTSLIHKGLQALIALESAKRLASLGGTEKALRPIPRRRVT